MTRTVSKKTEWTTVRITRDVFDRAQRASELMGDPGATWVIGQAVSQLLDMADAPPGQRAVPRLVKAIDALRSAAVYLDDAPAETRPSAKPERASGPEKVLRVGKG